MELKRLLLFSMMLVAVLACTPQVSQSTLVIPSSLEYMVNRSDTIVNGTIRDSHGYWEKKRIYTGVRVDVLQYIKSADSSQPATIELKVLGGQVGDTRLEIDRAPTFEPGEEVLLFLIKQGDKYQIYGIYYGACRVVLDEDGVSKRVVGPVFSESQVKNIETQQVTLNPLPSGGEKLKPFVQRIKNLANQK